MEMNTYLVGGAVRDQLLGVTSKDLDYSVEIPDLIGQPADVGFAAMRDMIEQQGFTIFLETPEHLTLRAKFPKEHENASQTGDFVLCREDGPSTDGRHPDWVKVGDLSADLARRDLTINALARAEDGTLIDPHGGREDLEAGRLRFVGEPEDRLAEDALRAFRALRFAVTKGFTMHIATEHAITLMHKEAFDAVSTDRIRDELHKMFAKDTAASITLLAHRFPLLLEVALDRGLWLRPTTEVPK